MGEVPACVPLTMGTRLGEGYWAWSMCSAHYAGRSIGLGAWVPLTMGHETGGGVLDLDHVFRSLWAGYSKVEKPDILRFYLMTPLASGLVEAQGLLS